MHAQFVSSPQVNFTFHPNIESTRIFTPGVSPREISLIHVDDNHQVQNKVDDEDDDDEEAILARLVRGARALLQSGGDEGVLQIIDGVLDEERRAADDDDVFKKPVGRAPVAKKKVAQSTFYSRKEVVYDFQRQTDPDLVPGPPVKGEALTSLMDVSERFMQKVMKNLRKRLEKQVCNPMPL